MTSGRELVGYADRRPATPFCWYYTK